MPIAMLGISNVKTLNRTIQLDISILQSARISNVTRTDSITTIRCCAVNNFKSISKIENLEQMTEMTIVHTFKVLEQVRYNILLSMGDCN